MAEIRRLVVVGVPESERYATIGAASDVVRDPLELLQVAREGTVRRSNRAPRAASHSSTRISP